MLFKIFNYNNTIISRYLLSNFLVFFIAITFIITLIIFGNQFVLTVQESIEYGIPIEELMPLVWFNMLRDISIILILSLFLSLIITVSQLYKNSEALVMNAIGLGDKNFIQIFQPAIFSLFLAVFLLALFIVPWAKQEKSITEEQTVNASEFSFISEGKFESFKNGEIVFYASESRIMDAKGEQNLEEIFIYASDFEKPVIVLASEGRKYIDSKTKSIYLRLKNGVRYEGIPGSENLNILDFDLYDLEIVSGEIEKSLSNFSEIEEKKTIDLLKVGGILANAEIQWRFSQPISVLILSVFGVLLGKTSHRNGKGLNLLIGIIIFMLYNNSLLVAKSAIENGNLNPTIGMWAIHLAMLIILIFFYQIRQGSILFFIDKITFFKKQGD
tara:strand:+ start:340 stop:1497 length:1158 start_codon:yes stop_codon:yes gene_type:complete